MTGTRFPIARRALAVAGAVLALGIAGPHVWASTQSDKDQAKRAFERAKDDLAAIDSQLRGIEADLEKKAAALDAAEAALNETTARLVDVESQVQETQAEYDQIVQRLNDRAVAAYMNGPGTSLDFLLGATSMADLSDRIEYVDAVARSDTQLAVDVGNVKARLLIQQQDLEELQVKQARATEAARTVHDEVLADFEDYQALEEQAQQIVSDAGKQYRDALKAWRASQRPQYGDPNVPLPKGYEHVLQVCPVDQPRSYWDGFGAPRYAGGYHLHKGNDILAPTGTPIRAPFDGYAQRSHNSLGGNVVFVAGKYGTVYNAHLSAYSANSTGPVNAGTVIGYVGDSGDAIGSPHDHFEFHPKVIPSGWPVSSYGYSVIDDAVNPYPLLAAACG